MVKQLFKSLAVITGTSPTDMERVAERYPVALTRFLQERVADGSYSPAALRQFVPDIRELDEVEGFVTDPTGEENLHPAPGILRCYQNRLAVIPTYKCLVYCRFCFRKDVVGFPENVVRDSDIDAAIEYLAGHTEITDILLSGGDPLAIPNHRLLPILRRLGEIEHIKAIRIDSRALNTHPDRFDDELLELLERDGRYWYYAHLNHPDDIDHPRVLAAVRRLLSARIPIYNQCVFLAGVNDDIQTMSRLMELCYHNKVIPYNLYVLDRVHGAAHFEVPNHKVIEIYQALDRLSGPAQPLLVYVGNDSRKRRATNCQQLDLMQFLESRGASA